MANKIYLETQKPVDGLGRLFNQAGPADLPIPEGSNVYLKGTSLVIPEQPAPKPVAEFDGVKYYHKQEFDLLNIFENAKEGYTSFNLITGETFVGGGCSYLSILNNSGAPGRQAELVLNMPKRFFVYATSPYSTVDYTSRAFICVDTPGEVTDNTKIRLAECSAYYGFLSEDGNTFISYYNLKADGATEYVDSIKQGENDIEIHDPRLEDEIAEVIAMIPEIPEIPETMPVIDVTMTYGSSPSCRFTAPDSGTLLLAKDSQVASRGFVGIIFRSNAFNDRYYYQLYKFGASKIEILSENSSTTHITGETVTLNLLEVFVPLFKHVLSFTKDSTTYKLSMVNNYGGRIGTYIHGTPKYMCGLYYIGHASETNILSPVRVKPGESDELFVFQDENDAEVTLSFANDFSGDTVTNYIY